MLRCCRPQNLSVLSLFELWIDSGTKLCRVINLVKPLFSSSSSSIRNKFRNERSEIPIPELAAIFTYDVACEAIRSISRWPGHNEIEEIGL